jgi:hypothetical protein
MERLGCQMTHLKWIHLRRKRRRKKNHGLQKYLLIQVL